MAEQVIELDGLLWKPAPGATASAEEFAAARAFIVKIHQEARWNPWVQEDSKQEYDAAVTVFEQWTRAEPDFRPMDDMDIDEWLKAQDEKHAAEQAQRESERQGRIPRFDAERHEARLALLECEAQLAHRTDERARLASRERSPAMPDSKRAEQRAELDASIASLRTRARELRDAVGDPETVVDARGWLPAERRELLLVRFRLWREREVRRLRSTVADLERALAPKVGGKGAGESSDKAERAKRRDELRAARRRLDQLLEIPPLSADDMCAECAHPCAWHGYILRGDFPPVAPCPAWPEWAKRIRKAREMIMAWSDDRRPATPEPPKPKPLAVIPSGLPIPDVMQRLAEIQADFPDAVVRRGSRNRWEIWPST